MFSQMEMVSCVILTGGYQPLMRWIRGFTNLLVMCLVTPDLVLAYNPTVKVQMCTETRLTLTLEGGANGGIIYIQGHGSACKQNTVTNTTVFEFMFDACGIDPYEAFTVVVQKKPQYQTGNDISYPVQCLFEFTIDLRGSDLTFVDGVDEEGVNITIRPTAKMILYSNGQEVTAGQVDLADILTMSIQLGSEFMADFDLKARYCTANTIEMIKDFCSTDTELFPNFAHPVQGVISSTFDAFRTTDLNGGIVDMTFSCTLQLCFGACSRTDCANGDVVYGRRKRLAENDGPAVKSNRRNKRMTDDDVAYENVNVGALISVGDTLDTDDRGDDFHQICINFTILVCSGSFLVFTAITCPVCVTSSFKKNRKGQTKKEQSKPEVAINDSFVCTPVSNSRFGTTTRRYSGQFVPV
ncbi:uncharacterized protein LOC117315046 [Pecten maximus]|uniref:uncharacterized protein LOC117315046 n=1 Tax=Pecten maximus TaxID=6579 RepID=UPI00145916A6|nr:uncharacterized protein LOC117315046 [Pecten maximus]